MDSNEDASNSQTTIPVLPLHQGPAASSQGPAASSQGPVASANSGDEDREKSDEYRAQSQDSGRTVPYPDLYVMMNIGHSLEFCKKSERVITDSGGRTVDALF